MEYGVRCALSHPPAGEYNDALHMEHTETPSLIKAFFDDQPQPEPKLGGKPPETGTPENPEEVDINERLKAKGKLFILISILNSFHQVLPILIAAPFLLFFNEVHPFFYTQFIPNLYDFLSVIFVKNWNCEAYV